MQEEETMPSITKADVVAKFKELHNSCYSVRGLLVSNVPDEVSEKVFANAVWHETYNRYASEHVYIRSLSVTVPLLGRKFIMEFDRPLAMDHHWEFEEYFGFGGHCNGYNANRTIARFQSKFDADISIDDLLLGEGPVDEEYAKEAIMLLVLGGYVKYWVAVREFEEWFGKAGLTECIHYTESKGLLTRIFEIMQFNEKKEKEKVD